MPLVIREAEVARLLTVPAAMDALERMFILKHRGGAMNQPRQRPAAGGATLQVMPAAAAGVGLALKAYSVVGGRARFLVLLWDDADGKLLALIEADELGRIRTGAASGVATKYLARANSETLGVFGAGYQAKTQVAAVCHARAIREVRVYSRDEGRRTRFAEEVGRSVGARVRPVAAPEAAAECDVVVTVTGAKVPLFPASMLRADAHINAAGSNRADARELGADVIRRCSAVYIDDLPQGERECGDVLLAVADGAARWDEVREIASAIAVPDFRRPDGITLFESQGIALEDLAVARIVYERARETGAGTELQAGAIG